MWERHQGEVDFMVVYIREAHPVDGWVVNMNREAGIELHDPTTDGERRDAAESCALGLQIRIPVVVDPVDDLIASAYGALPDRLYLIGKGGRIVYQGARGPFGFKPDALEAAIRDELG
jgi:hypothetical protein